MHSRIIQMETKPVVERIKQTDFSDHWFTASIADYVDEDYNTEDTLETLCQVFSTAAGCVEFFEDKNGRGVVFHDGFRQGFFGANYNAFLKALAALREKATLESFCSGAIYSDLYDLNTAYESDIGYYIQNDELGLKPLSGFVRLLEFDTRYYFGGTLDYHF